MYHDIYRNSPTESGFQNPTALKYKVHLNKFEAQVASVYEYLKAKNLPVETVDFTFDDGGESFLTIAAPILEKHGFKGKFFISTNFIGSKGFLNTDQIKELNRRGHIIGSHSHSHPERMSSLSQQEIIEEWKISQLKLKEILGEIPTCASIPNGYSSKTILQAMVEAGITNIDTSATTTHIRKFHNASIRGRFAITDEMPVDEVMLLIKSPFCRLKKNIRWRLLSIAKIILGDSYLKLRNTLTK